MLSRKTLLSKPPSTTTTIIRKARKNDTNRIIELLCQLGRQEPRNEQEMKHFAKLVQTYISEKKAKKKKENRKNKKNTMMLILVAEVDSKVVGIASLVFLPRLNRTRPEAWIPDFIVDQQYRNRGIGKKLLEKCISIAKKEKCWRIRLETGLSRKGAQRFYKKLQMEPFALAFMLSL
jgi:ribosomal protein S18 acetylase RimI-like enzyme